MYAAWYCIQFWFAQVCLFFRCMQSTLCVDMYCPERLCRVQLWIQRHQLSNWWAVIFTSMKTYFISIHLFIAVNPCDTNNGGCGTRLCSYTGPGSSQCAQTSSSSGASGASLAIGLGVGLGVFAVVIAVLALVALIRGKRRAAPLPTSNSGAGTESWNEVHARLS